MSSGRKNPIKSGEKQRRGHGEGVIRDSRAASFLGEGGEDLEATDASRNQASVTHCSRRDFFFLDNAEFSLAVKMYTLSLFFPKSNFS